MPKRKSTEIARAGPSKISKAASKTRSDTDKALVKALNEQWKDRVLKLEDENKGLRDANAKLEYVNMELRASNVLKAIRDFGKESPAYTVKAFSWGTAKEEPRRSEPQRYDDLHAANHAAFVTTIQCLSMLFEKLDPIFDCGSVDSLSHQIHLTKPSTTTKGVLRGGRHRFYHRSKTGSFLICVEPLELITEAEGEQLLKYAKPWKLVERMAEVDIDLALQVYSHGDFNHRVFQEPDFH